MKRKDHIYLAIIIVLLIPLIYLLIERQGQISVCYDVFENIIQENE